MSKKNPFKDIRVKWDCKPIEKVIKSKKDYKRQNFKWQNEIDEEEIYKRNYREDYEN